MRGDVAEEKKKKKKREVLHRLLVSLSLSCFLCSSAPHNVALAPALEGLLPPPPSSLSSSSSFFSGSFVAVENSHPLQEGL